MYPVTDRFLAAVRQSGTLATRLDITDPAGLVLGTVTPSGGDVSIDSRRQVRRECSFTVPDITGLLVPAAAGDLLSPLSGNELRPWRGVTYSDGTTELAPLGVMPIRSAPSSTSAGVAVITLGGQDRSSTVSRNRWEKVYAIAAGTLLEDALTALLLDRAPLYPTAFGSTGVTVPATTFGLETDSDPWADAQSLAKAAGFDLFYDATGTAVLTQPVDPATATPVISYTSAEVRVLAEASKSWDTEKAFNGCIAIGESATLVTPVRAEAWDDDPASPTYYRGAYGRYPEFYASPLITTEDQALNAARAQVARRRGVAQTLTWSQLVNPAHDANDAISVTSDALRVTTPLTVVLDAVRIPWGAGDTMGAETRSRQVEA